MAPSLSDKFLEEVDFGAVKYIEVKYEWGIELLESIDAVIKFHCRVEK